MHVTSYAWATQGGSGTGTVNEIHKMGQRIVYKFGAADNHYRTVPYLMLFQRSQVTLLDAKQSMNTNIFLRQFKR